MHLKSIGFSLGSKKLRVSDLFDDRRLIEKTGIEFLFEAEGSTHDLALAAVQELGDFNRASIKACIMITQTPDDLLPANAIPLSNSLGLPTEIMSFDVNQGCSGFVQALILVESLAEKYGDILLVTADRYRSKLGQDNRGTNAVFSDGASASIWGAGGTKKILLEKHITDGSKRDWLFQSNSVGAPPLHMSGADVWMFTRTVVVPSLLNIIDETQKMGYRIGQVFLHQASKLVLDGIVKELPDELRQNVPLNYYKYGNTVSSTIPILLAESQLCTDEDTVDIFCGFGVGLSSSIVVM